MRIQAASEGCVRLLEDEGADKDVKDIDGMTYLDHANVARKYVMLSNSAETKYGKYPLSTAAMKGDDETVKALIATGYKHLNEWDGYPIRYNTALNTYAARGCESMLKALIVAGANMEEESVSGVMMLATNDKLSSLEPQGKNRYTPLEAAAREGHEACVRLLVEAGAVRSRSALSLAKTEAIKTILCS
jgi:ankyrin repeat protein